MERINGEILTGISLIVLAILFIIAAQLNAVWALIVTGSYLILAFGFAFLALGLVTLMKNRNKPEEKHSSH